MVNSYSYIALYTRAFSYTVMIASDRVRARMADLGLSQSELARRVGVSQATIYKLVSGESFGSKHLHRIARALGTTADYLEGTIDDPNEGALPAPPQPATFHLMMPVALPTEQALSQMFEGMLEVADRTAPVDELARELAQLLPTALSQLRGPLSYAPEVRPGAGEAAAAPATADLAVAR